MAFNFKIFEVTIKPLKIKQISLHTNLCAVTYIGASKFNSSISFILKFAPSRLSLYTVAMVIIDVLSYDRYGN